MGAHIVNGQFQSDKYPTCPAGKVPLSVRDPSAQDLLWEYAHRRRLIDAEFSDDLRQALWVAGYRPPEPAKAVIPCPFCKTIHPYEDICSSRRGYDARADAHLQATAPEPAKCAHSSVIDIFPPMCALCGEQL